MSLVRIGTRLWREPLGAAKGLLKTEDIPWVSVADVVIEGVEVPFRNTSHVPRHHIQGRFALKRPCLLLGGGSNCGRSAAALGLQVALNVLQVLGQPFRDDHVCDLTIGLEIRRKLT